MDDSVEVMLDRYPNTARGGTFACCMMEDMKTYWEIDETEIRLTK